MRTDRHIFTGGAGTLVLLTSGAARQLSCHRRKLCLRRQSLVPFLYHRFHL
jgi:hypothetical protein